MPTCGLNDKPVLGIRTFKKHFCLWVHQAVFLIGKQNLLIKVHENKSKAPGQMRFETKAEIIEAIVLANVTEAIGNQHLRR